MDYFKSHYSPSNVIVCVAGAVNQNEIEEKIKNYFKDKKDEAVDEKVNSKRRTIRATTFIAL